MAIRFVVHVTNRAFLRSRSRRQQVFLLSSALHTKIKKEATRSVASKSKVHSRALLRGHSTYRYGSSQRTSVKSATCLAHAFTSRTTRLTMPSSINNQVRASLVRKKKINVEYLIGSEILLPLQKKLKRPIRVRTKIPSALTILEPSSADRTASSIVFLQYEST